VRASPAFNVCDAGKRLLCRDYPSVVAFGGLVERRDGLRSSVNERVKVDLKRSRCGSAFSFAPTRALRRARTSGSTDRSTASPPPPPTLLNHGRVDPFVFVSVGATDVHTVGLELNASLRSQKVSMWFTLTASWYARDTADLIRWSSIARSEKILASTRGWSMIARFQPSESSATVARATGVQVPSVLMATDMSRGCATSMPMSGWALHTRNPVCATQCNGQRGYRGGGCRRAVYVPVIMR